ncbi:MAG: 5-formyltetrahydrofolate cyclo-ligase [Deltaproteobacteria bacterium]|nr:5-formyltetrahydrofolate cyclo-ligase [Deltaproteobacteria bacterium]
MDDAKAMKEEIRKETAERLASISRDELSIKCAKIEERLFDFANFREAAVALMYLGYGCGLGTSDIMARLAQSAKDIVLPLFVDPEKYPVMYKIIDPVSDIIKNPEPAPDTERCKEVGIAEIDIAIIPGIAFDEKGGRIGMGTGRYDRLIPKLANTTRKVALAFEEQIVTLVPMQSHDQYVDIIITDKRTIYKI